MSLSCDILVSNYFLYSNFVEKINVAIIYLSFQMHKSMKLPCRYDRDNFPALPLKEDRVHVNINMT